ncbi:MAG: UPF0716 protein FxsA [Planctomycetota bacterium]|jgi:UPF0716 protein FxsA
MFRILTLIFLIVPIVEIYFLIQVGQIIGAGWTILLVVLTAVIGVRLLKVQGISTMARAQQKMNLGEIPAKEMLEGMGLVMAGALLLTPGFFTDAVGFLLLFPPTRLWLVGHIVPRMVVSHSAGFSSQPGQPRKNDVIEGVNYRKED